MIIDLIRSVPANTFDSALLAYSWNLFSQDGWPVSSDRTMHLLLSGIRQLERAQPRVIL